MGDTRSSSSWWLFEREGKTTPPVLVIRKEGPRKEGKWIGRGWQPSPSSIEAALNGIDIRGDRGWHWQSVGLPIRLGPAGHILRWVDL